MSKFIDLTGQKFGRLTVIERASNQGTQTMWLCICKCGKQSIAASGHLKSGRIKSCGCLAIKLRTKHGHNCRNKRSKTYVTWQNIIQRCTNSNHKHYKHYGGRGIRVCEAWMKFENFFEDMGEKPEELSIDRINNNGDYCKVNCKWSDRKEQHRNTRRAILVTINGVIKPLAEWCEMYQKPYYKVKNRLNLGWTPEEALEIVPRKRKNQNERIIC